MDLYKVADVTFGITNIDTRAWEELKWHYDPFIQTDSQDKPMLSIAISKGYVDTSDYTLYFDDIATNKDDMSLTVYKDGTTLIFKLQQPYCDQPNCWLTIDGDCTNARITLDEDNTDIPYWKHITALTAAIQLSYILTTSTMDILMSHASSVVHDGRAYLFIAKSGTGKSTHSKLWLEHIPDTLLLNDDHPIVRVHDDGSVIAYGAPWSGKTHCYKNLSYPVGAIVRIKRSAVNRIHRQSPVLAYASVSTSFSGFKWHKQYADLRHKTLERIVGAVPCYELECRPDQEAAQVCFDQVSRQA